MESYSKMADRFELYRDKKASVPTRSCVEILIELGETNAPLMGLEFPGRSGIPDLHKQENQDSSRS